jgi:hypothetical protein
MVPAVASNVPLFVIVPDILIVLPAIVSEEPLSIVKLLTVAAEPVLRTGLFVTLGIVTWLIWVGTAPQDQFPVSFQSLLTVPVHWLLLLMVRVAPVLLRGEVPQVEVSTQL